MRSQFDWMDMAVDPLGVLRLTPPCLRSCSSWSAKPIQVGAPARRRSWSARCERLYEERANGLEGGTRVVFKSPSW